MKALANSLVVIILQYVGVPNQCAVHLILTQRYMSVRPQFKKIKSSN